MAINRLNFLTTLILMVVCSLSLAETGPEAHV